MTNPSHSHPSGIFQCPAQTSTEIAGLQKFLNLSPAGSKLEVFIGLRIKYNLKAIKKIDNEAFLRESYFLHGFVSRMC